MSQDKDNNEAAGAPDLHSAIMNLPCNPPDGWGGIQQTGYKLGHRDARHAAAELVSASASQSSTAGAATHIFSTYTGKSIASIYAFEGEDFYLKEEVDNYLAHVARQESAPAHETIIHEGSSLVCTACGTTTAPDTAAVAEGVDTALPEPDHSLDCGMQPFFRLDQMTTYGAQQREAERRRQMERIRLIEGQRDIAQATCREFSKALDEAELARQPVSEGLTALHKLCERITKMKRTKFLMPGTGQNYSYLLWEDASFHVEEARKSIATPAPEQEAAQVGRECTCPSGDGSLAWPCPQHPPGDVMPPTRGTGSLLNADELAALRRFDECAQDGEGYDVPKEMMQRLAEIGVVRRKSGAYYEATDFGQHVLGNTLTVEASTSHARAMARRFLGWKLPADFSPDSGISFKPYNMPHLWPIGTNLFNEDQATAMFNFCLQGVVPATAGAANTDKGGEA